MSGSTCVSCGWTVATCVCQKRSVRGGGSSAALSRPGPPSRSASSPTIVRGHPAAAAAAASSSSPHQPSHFLASSPSAQPSHIPAQPHHQPLPPELARRPSALTLRGPPMGGSAATTSLASIPALLTMNELFAPCCQQLALCARREGPVVALKDAVQKLSAAGRFGWLNVLSQCAYQDCIDVLAHLLRTVDGALVTAECVKWFLDMDLVADEEHRFQLFFSLLHCLPPQNRAWCMMLSEGFAEFPSVAALSLGPALLGLHPALPSGHAFVKFLVSLPSRPILMEPLEGSCFAVGSCAASRVLFLLVDPYYCGVIDPLYPTLLADMNLYFWSSPEACLLSVGEQVRRFMRPGAWAVDARARLVAFVVLLVERWLASTPAFVPNGAFRKNWTWLLQLLVHPLNIGGDDVPSTMRESVRGLASTLFAESDDVLSRASGFDERGASMETPLEEQSPKAAARALRRLFLSSYCNLSLSHMVKQRWMTAALSPPFADLVTMFNGLQSWAVSWILESPKPKERGARIAWIIRCAHHCKKLNNLHATIALFLASSDPAISRLAKSWAHVSSKAQGYLGDLKLLADPKNNHQVYSAALKAASAAPPVIPYLALSSKYLFSMGDANPDVIESSGFLNINKFRMIQTFIVSMLELKAGSSAILSQQVPSNELALAAFLFLCCKGTYDNQAMYALSLEKEPRVETE